MKKRLILLLIFVYSSFSFCQDRTADLPVLNSTVNDFEDLFEFHQEIFLKKNVEIFNDKSGIQIIIVTVKSVEPYNNIFDFSLDLANKSGMGKIYIVVSDNLRQVQIQNHDTILDKLTNEKTKLILEQFIIPRFKEGKYYTGIVDGITEIKKEF